MSGTIRTEKIAGIAVEISVDRSGFFHAEVPGAETDHLRADTLEGVLVKAREAIQRLKAMAKTSIPITVLGVRVVTKDRWCGPITADEGSFVDCTLRGIHSRLHNLLVTIDGKNEQIDNRQRVARRLADDEKATYQALVKAKQDATKALEDFMEPLLIDPEKVTAAVPAAATDPGLQPAAARD